MAKFRVELIVGPLKSNRLPFPGIIGIWETNESGDLQTLVSLCPRCKNPLLGDIHYGTIVDGDQTYIGYVCDQCGQKFRLDEVIQFVIGNLTVDGWAEALVKYVKILGMDTDLVLRRFRMWLKKALVEAMEHRNAKAMDIVDHGQMASSEMATYSAERLVQDTAAGRDLLDTVKAFLRA